MKVKLGDTIEFDYTAPEIHDRKPLIFFLAKVGDRVHGLNQHYQSPQEKVYYFLMLKNVLYNKLQTKKIDAETFYRLYVRNRLVTNSYRTYKTGSMSGIKVVPHAWEKSPLTRGINVKRQTGNYHIYRKGDRVRYVSMLRGKLSWVKGTILGRKPPGADYAVRTDDGRIVVRHPSDLRLETP